MVGNRTEFETETVASRWSSPDSGVASTVIDPSTGRTIATVHGSTPALVNDAVVAAARGFRSWSRREPRERASALRAIAAAIADRVDEFAELESQEVGKPISQARDFDLPACIAVFEYFAALCESRGDTFRRTGALDNLTSLSPFGVVAAIVPFNWPPIHTAGKLAPALAVGNAVIVKPGEQAPLTIMRLVDLVQEILPDDVVHVVPGGADVGAALVSHPLVRKISFTGAPRTGMAVMRAAAENLTPVLMELGGKNPVIIFDDADVDLAVRAVVEAAYFNQGEACTAGSRILVQRPIYDEVVDRLARAVGRLRVGDPALEETHVGPMVDRAQQRRSLEYLEIGVAEGARIAAQADLPGDPGLVGGFWVPPTLFVDVLPGMRIAREEIFGPITAVMVFDTDQEAVEIADGTEFGLVATVFSRDVGRARRAADQIEAGIVHINNFHRAYTGIPFGGTKHSGFGREHAEATLGEYGYLKTIRSPSGLGPVPRWRGAEDVTTD